IRDFHVTGVQTCALPICPTVYLSYRQRPMRTWSMTAVLRPAAGDAAALVAPVRGAVAAIDADVAVRFATIEQRLARTLTQRRFVDRKSVVEGKRLGLLA